MLQKEIWAVDFEPVKGNEQRGLRPSVIISGNAMNRNTGISIVCPLTSSIKSYPGTVFMNKNKKKNLKNDSEILVFQIKTVTHERFHNKIGTINDVELQSILEEMMNVCKY
jgi:mRNA interferase MazF